jgi:hypothetical protein
VTVRFLAAAAANRDFASGQKPVKWQYGVAGLATELAPLPGHWAVLGREYIVLQPLAVPTPLPADFTVTYDLVAAEKFTWGAKGMTFELGAGKSPRIRSPISG